MDNEQKSDTSQVLWFDLAVVLIIVVIAMVSNVHPYVGRLLHHGH